MKDRQAKTEPLGPGQRQQCVSGEIGLGFEGDYSTLLCPCCGGDNLHHSGVVAYDRREDEETLTRTEVSGGLVGSHIVPSHPSGNPSGRRNGLVISFYCENCSADPIELRVAQSKGRTYVDWSYVKHPARDDLP